MFFGQSQPVWGKNKQFDSRITLQPLKPAEEIHRIDSKHFWNAWIIYTRRTLKIPSEFPFKLMQI